MKKLYIVGLGPGERGGRSLAAECALSGSEILIGYTKYIELIQADFPDKEILSTGMMQEIDRCRMALSEADKGRIAALVCSGDAGVYGMASPLLELWEAYPEVEIEVVPGITAALSGAAVLGAPLAHDFCVISLSDLMTDMMVIEKRLHAAAQADFCIALYNPRSRKRSDYLEKAAEILLQYKPADTLCGYVKNIGREGEESGIFPLSALSGLQADMFTTVFIGNAETREIRGKMVTPRGYRIG